MMIQLHDEWCRKYPDVVNEFFLKGQHAVRYSDGNWGGVWSDMAIKQTLMKSAKTSGGLAHGALRYPDVLKTWVITAPHTSEVSDTMLPVYEGMKRKRKRTNSSSTTRNSTAAEKRDKDIVEKLVDFFKDNSPFSTETDPSTLISLSSGY